MQDMKVESIDQHLQTPAKENAGYEEKIRKTATRKKAEMIRAG